MNTRMPIPALPRAHALLAVTVGWCVCAAAGCVAKSHEESFDIGEAFERVEVSLPTGAVTVVGHDGSGATLDATSHWQGSRKPDLEVGVEGKVLAVRVDCGPLSMCSVDARLSLPKHVAFSMWGATGDLVVRELDGDVEADLTTGAVTLVGVGGKLDIETTTGDVRGTHLSSQEAEVSATTGDIALAFEAGAREVEAEVTTGRIDLELPAGSYAIDAETTTGSVELDAPRDPASERRVTARTTTGNITVRAAPSPAPEG